MTDEDAPPFPRCVGCNQRLNVWTLRYCQQCQNTQHDNERTGS